MRLSAIRDNLASLGRWERLALGAWIIVTELNPEDTGQHDPDRLYGSACKILEKYC